MGVRETLRKAKDLIVESPDDSRPSDRPVDQGKSQFKPGEPPLSRIDNKSAPEQPGNPTAQAREAAGLDQAKGPTTSPQSMMTDLSVDFAGIYRQANLPSVAFTAEQMMGMLSELPTELPLDTKRRTVKVTLNTMGKSVGATPETIVADAYGKRTVLAAYVDSVSRQTEKLVASAEAEIARLRVQIEDKRVAIEVAQNKQVRAVQMCQAESAKLDNVLEFFSSDVSPASYSGHREEKG